VKLDRDFSIQGRLIPLSQTSKYFLNPSKTTSYVTLFINVMPMLAKPQKYSKYLYKFYSANPNGINE
tara:strand:+ start:282 stop:482 length:201 start_codon:yes stop_codon:yes gene_type:complete